MGNNKRKRFSTTRKWAFVKKRRKSKKEASIDENAEDESREEITDHVSMDDIITSSTVDGIGCTVEVLQKEKGFPDSTRAKICTEIAASENRMSMSSLCARSSCDSLERFLNPEWQELAEVSEYNTTAKEGTPACSLVFEKRIGKPIRTYSKRGIHAGSGSADSDLQQAMPELTNTRFDNDSGVACVVNEGLRDEICVNDVDKLLHDENSRNYTNVQVNDSATLEADVNAAVESARSSGRHIVNIKYLLEKLHEKFDAHDPNCTCSIRDMDMWKHVDRGMRSQLFFRCRNCGFKSSVWTDPINVVNEMSIHEGTVCGTLVAGVGFATMQAQLAAMGVRCISHVTYRKVRDSLAPHIENASMREMSDAAQTERALARTAGDVTPEGIPFISVMVDGAWSKRSYRGGRYDALSGTAVIVGARTGRVLFCGVRNKYCCICNKATGLGQEPPIHDCYKNWGQHQSSTSMEPDIIAEGFGKSLEMHGLIYKTLIGDGDSSVYQTVIDNDPYAAYNIRVQKVECKNHLFRNFCGHIENASKARFTKKPPSGSVTALRARIKSSALKMRRFIETAVKLRNEQNSTRARQAEDLMHDILKMPGHFFGDHSLCDLMPENCDRSEANIVPLLCDVGIYHIIESVVERLATNADSLLEDKTTNPAESYHSQGNRFNGGRRVNNSLRDSFQIRAHCAVVQHNTLALSSKIYRSAGKEVPRVVDAMEASRRLQVERTRIHRDDNGRKRRRRWYGTDKDYGPSCRQPDISQSAYDGLVENHFEKLRKRQLDRLKVERDTATQSECELWHVCRRDMITASKFGEICRMKESTSCSRLVKAIRYPKPFDSADITFGRVNETTAREQLAILLGIEISISGLFIDEDIPYLGASPDGLIHPDGIVEIKCLAKAENDTPETAIQKFPAYKNFFTKDSTEYMNKKHKYFHQVQGQLHITQREYCIFTLWTPLGIKHITVLRDDEFWKNEMEPKLIRFYTKCVLPEIVDGRHNRHLDIREPEYILQAQELEKAKKAGKKSRNNVASAMLPTNESCGNIQTLESVEVDASETVVDLTSARNDTCFESLIPYMAVDNDEEVIDEEMLVHQLQNISVDNVIANVLDTNDILDDESIELFLQIVGENCDFNIMPVILFGYQNVLQPSVTQHDLLIIGGNEYRHWCCIRCEKTSLFVYDSFRRRTYAELHENEKSFIRKRYPRIRINNIVFPDVATQPDNYSCGVYSAAFATAVALGQDPSNPKHVGNANVMREHMARIIERRELLPFPTEI